MTKEALVDSPPNHGRYLHGAGKGRVTVAQKTPDWQQRSYQTQQLNEVLPSYGGLNDVYISQNRFWGSRTVSSLAQLSAMFVDLDYYKISDLADMHPLGVTEIAFEELERAKIPRPSLAVATGRGLALTWRHDPVPRCVLPKWNLCQDHIFKALRDLGADRSARDAARVLRLVGSRNSKSGTIVEGIWEEHGCVIWSFDDLADEILPLSREELEERRARQREKSKNREKLAAKGARKPSKGRPDPEKRLTIATLAEGRLSDLQRLLKLRGLDKLPPGERDLWMFVAGTSLAYLVDAQYLERELIELGREYADWSESETRSSMHTVLSRARGAKAGETIEWQGQRRDPRYRLTTQRIIENLSITPTEEKQMKVLISKDTKRQRDRERKEQERRAQGAKPRDEYLADARAREKESRAKELNRQGLSLRKIGKELGVSHTHVRRMLAAQS